MRKVDQRNSLSRQHVWNDTNHHQRSVAMASFHGLIQNDSRVGSLLRRRLEVTDHQASKYSHNHLCLDFNNVVWQCVYLGANLTSHGDGILSIRQLVLNMGAYQLTLTCNARSINARNGHTMHSFNKPKANSFNIIWITSLLNRFFFCICNEAVRYGIAQHHTAVS